MIKTQTIQVNSSDQVPEFLDITQKVERLVKESEIQEGQVTVFAQHTTAAIILQEAEPGVHKDVHELLHSLLPRDKHYHHALSPDHVKDQMPNGHAHCQHVLLGPSEVIPILEGKMLLGQFQRIFLVELDRARDRTVVVQVIGE